MKTSIIMCALILLCLSAVQAGERPVIRPFAGIGTLMGAPSASDLDYVDADGGDLNQYLKQKKMSPFAGVQVLVPFKPRLRLGGELSYRRLFSSTFNTGSSDISFINTDYDTDAEYDLAVLGIIEYQPASSMFFIMGGAGMHIVRWTFDSEYDSKYSYSSSSYGGSGTNLGIMGAGGVRLPLSPTLSMPVMARFDYIMRYGGMIPLSLTAGLEFSI